MQTHYSLTKSISLPQGYQMIARIDIDENICEDKDRARYMLTCGTDHLCRRDDTRNWVQGGFYPLCKGNDDRNADPLLPILAELLEHLPRLSGRRTLLLPSIHK